MNGVAVIVVAAVVLAAGYLVYGRWLAKSWGVDNAQLTPARRMMDGKNFSPPPASPRSRISSRRSAARVPLRALSSP